MTLIYPTDRKDAGRLARQLLDLAGPERHHEVRTNTDGALSLAFEVPDDIADAVLGTGDSRVVQPSLNVAAEGGEENTSAEVGGESAPLEVGEESASVVARADGSEMDAEPASGASQPPSKAVRSRSSRSR
ncbi:hypothetical protein [Micromonospora endophytica]|uniref:Uncharacterized protein n=1 Tax=Micromonospora endophytica TaxID=515350 RepID=A0A2W2CIX2_9ACTN|nr:hypothetical protein [Micromonospora endophytica]PZF99401.1 hypothetical protein C1I93_05955 [Micromonospora endophytica]RIW42890.1 hypothetical protein D3H59_21940 [Micromonospora endophytica]BCJ61592.1 hypothetical protein Jiend_50140 [Micromonospora endophytica]